MSDLVATIAQAAEALECSESLVRKLVAEGRLPHIKLSSTAKKTVIPWFALHEWLAREAVPADARQRAARALESWWRQEGLRLVDNQPVPYMEIVDAVVDGLRLVDFEGPSIAPRTHGTR